MIWDITDWALELLSVFKVSAEGIPVNYIIFSNWLSVELPKSSQKYLEKWVILLLILQECIQRSKYQLVFHNFDIRVAFQAICTIWLPHLPKERLRCLLLELGFWRDQNRKLLLHILCNTWAGGVKEDVAGLEISVYELGRVQIFEYFTKLVGDEPDMSLLQYFLPDDWM